MLTNCLSRSRYVNQSSSDSEQSNVDAHTTQPIAARLLWNASCATIFVKHLEQPVLQHLTDESQFSN